MGIGFGELIVIAVIGLIFIGPKDLPRIMRSLGQGFRKIKDMGDEFMGALDKEVENPKKYIKDLDGKLQETFTLDDIKK